MLQIDFFKKIKYSIDINRAFSKNEKGEYAQSLLLLKKHRSFAMRSKMLLPDYFILEAENLTRLKRYEDAEESFAKILGILEETPYFNSDEKNYLRAYVIAWLLFLKNHVKFKNEKIDELVNSEFEFDLNNIRKPLKINFHQNIEG